MKLSQNDLCNLYNCVSIALAKASAPTPGIVKELEDLQKKLEAEIDKKVRR